MQHRIVVIGAGAKKIANMRKTLEKKDALVISSPADQPVPAHAAGIFCSTDPAETLDAAIALSEQQNALLILLAEAVDAREDIPAGAAERVRRIAVQLGKAIALNAAELSVLERGALLRGIGKLCLPNAILLKKSVLNYDDWLLLQSHATLGATLLRERGVCADVADIVQCYHECWDGTGYPNGLEGDAIPKLARIVRLADVYCAMTSPRVYRQGHVSTKEALAHIRNERGKHFDPELVDAFIGAKTH